MNSEEVSYELIDVCDCFLFLLTGPRTGRRINSFFRWWSLIEAKMSPVNVV